MPLEYERDDRRRLITVTLTDPFLLEELLGQVDRQWAEHTWDYAVLYDGRTIAALPPVGDLQRLVDHARIVGDGRPRGPVGVVIPPRPDAGRNTTDPLK
jgi:hypothetical protein